MQKVPYIFLAEDSDDDTFFARRCLAAVDASIKIERAANGVELCSALEDCGSNLPMAVILDLKMPLMDGFETLKWIRAQPAFKKLPVIILSSSDMIEDKRRARRLGCTEYLVKPHSLIELTTLFRELIERLLHPSPYPGSAAPSRAPSPGMTHHAAS